MTKNNYHLGELAISRNPTDPRHNMPTIPDECRSILDVGCGAGQTLMDLKALKISMVGLDIDKDALKLGKGLTERIHFVNGSMHHLPFRKNSFDMVISRVALPLTNIPYSLKSIHSVLKPAGSIWISLYSFSMQKKLLLDSIHQKELKSVVYNLYALLNGFIFHFWGKMVSFPWRPNQFRSFQSSKRMTDLLRKTGFERIVATKRGIHFNITAQKMKVDRQSGNGYNPFTI